MLDRSTSRVVRTVRTIAAINETRFRSVAKPVKKVADKSARGRIVGRKLSMKFSTRSGDNIVLDDLDIEVRGGEFIALLGPSGCGKSTLLNLFAGILKPTGGSVSIDDKPIKGPNSDVGIVFQQHSLFPWMSVLENVAFGPKMLGRADPIGTARTFLALVGLDKFETAWPSSLSGGMQQRVGIARALATYPPVLLMDEPFGALDAQTRSIMQDELLKLWSQFNSTVVFVTHDIEEAIFLADRVIVMKTMPGGIKTEVNIELPRPRSPDVIKTDKFNFYRGQILELIREETLKVFNPSK
ncbi:MAG: ABC transporter ATP-binding protein [Bradyrhizobiaceae bacterium]|nr:MAG: ABC transporter ATP-binding protein [Bradyrhizobiaceae bacterium]